MVFLLHVITFIVPLWILFKNILFTIVLSACDIKGVGAAACIVYTSSLDLELGVMESFSAFLRYLNCSRQLHVNQKGGTLDARSKTGNLYV